MNIETLIRADLALAVIEIAKARNVPIQIGEITRTKQLRGQLRRIDFEICEPHKETPKKIEIDTRPYERGHGKKPSGQGYWAFKIGSDPDAYWSKPAQKFEQAIADAVKLAVCHEAVIVTVMP